MKDFNDLHQEQGLEAVRVCLYAACPADAIPAQAPEATRPEPASPAKPEPANDWSRIVAQLAQLHPFDYDQIRKDEAGKLGVRPDTLDKEVSRARAALAGTAQEAQGSKLELYEPDPWHVPVNIADVLNSIYLAIKRHMAILDEYALIAALWAAHAHVFEAFSHTPRLVITAPDAECGKSVLLFHLIGNLVPRPLSTEDLTPAVFYRVIELLSPTLLGDEFDTFIKQDSSLIGGCNGGWEPQGGALRCVGEDQEVRRFSTYAPLAMAGIKLHKLLPPATLSRSFVITLERAIDGEIAEIYDRDKHRDGLLELGRKLARWSKDYREILRRTKPALPSNARNRKADKWRPLFTIAEVAGGDWPKRVLRAYLAEEQDGSAAKLSTALQLLADIREVMKPDEHAIFTAELIERLCALEESPWLEHNFRERDEDRRKLQDRQVSKLLRDYKVKPGTVRLKTGTARGYKRVDLEIAWKRYLSPAEAATPPQSGSHKTPDPDNSEVL
jgi:putative DNA primase/helicase